MTSPGTPIHLDYRKWDGREHWQEPSLYLGEDQHGHWLYVPAGTVSARPGARFEAITDAVRLVPDAPHLAIVNGPQNNPEAANIYVDITTVPQWHETREGWTIRCVDLDLDVIRRYNGLILVDDEDEFALHQQMMNYPAEVIEQTERSCADVLATVQNSQAPFDGPTADKWFALGRDQFRSHSLTRQ